MTESDDAAPQSTYVLATGAGDPAARLRLVDEVYGASTRQMLLEAGLRPGMRVLDVVCGVGTVSCWMAGQGGPTGQAVAVDICSAQWDVARGTWQAFSELAAFDFISAS